MPAVPRHLSRVLQLDDDPDNLLLLEWLVL